MSAPTIEPMKVEHLVDVGASKRIPVGQSALFKEVDHDNDGLLERHEIQQVYFYWERLIL